MYSGFNTDRTEFGNDMSLVISVPLYGKIVSCLKEFFTVYMTTLNMRFEREWSNKQYFNILANGNFVVEELMPKVAAQLAAVTDYD